MKGIEKPQISSAGSSTDVLIPVDFSPKQNLSLEVGFKLAERLNSSVTLIHASIVPEPMIIPQFPDDFNGMDNENTQIEEMEMEEEVDKINKGSMSDLERRLRLMQTEGKLPAVKFDNIISPGMPEEVIKEYCLMSPPKIVVMATRGIEKRKEELVGSVTAEVIDQAVAPVFTVPEDYDFPGLKAIERICLFCYFEEYDVTAVSKLMELFSTPNLKIILFPATDKIKGEALQSKMKNLVSQLENLYPGSEFLASEIDMSCNLRDNAETMFRRESIQMILVPNKKRNAILRFFNPGLAHKILYEIDFPLLAIPV